jgi:hypothetical protein
MHYNPQSRLTSESYIYLSVIITIISLGECVSYSNCTGTRYLRNHNVAKMYRILAYPAITSLLYVMYHRTLHNHKFKSHNLWGMCGILVYQAIRLLLFEKYHTPLVAYQYN